MGVTGALRPIVAGVDPTPASRGTTVAAARQARRELRPLRLVRALPPGESVTADTVPGLDELAALATAVAPALPVTTVTRRGPAERVLLDEARTAARLVVGAGSAAGPLATALGRRSPCPLELHRGGAPGGPVVVGVDGGPGTAALLAVAVAEAAVRSRDLVVLHAVGDDRTGGGADPAVTATARDGVERWVAPVRAGWPEVPVRTEIAGTRPVPALLAAGRTAALLVVGRRDDPGPAAAWTSAVAAGAACPVLVVPLHAADAERQPSRARRSAVALTASAPGGAPS